MINYNVCEVQRATTKTRSNSPSPHMSILSPELSTHLLQNFFILQLFLPLCHQDLVLTSNSYQVSQLSLSLFCLNSDLNLTHSA